MNKSLAIGCVVVSAILAIMATVAVVVAPKLLKLGVSTFKSAMADAQRIAEFESNWNPPGKSVDASWFPKTVGPWELQGVPAPVAGDPELVGKGLEASYASGGETVKVRVRPANSLEKEALFARAKEENERGNGTRSSSQLGNRHNFTANGTDRTVVWWIRGWYFVFQTHGKTELAPFAETYLGAIGAEPAPKPADSTETPAPAAEKPAATPARE